jgi:DNA ligase-1
MKPMLATALNWDLLKYPVYVSPKLDGIRCIVENGVPRSRTWKALPNAKLRQACREFATTLQYLDGEIVVGDPTAKNVYNATMSGIMSEGGDPNFSYLVFDWVGDPDQSYVSRLSTVVYMASNLPGWVSVVPQVICHNREDVERIEEEFVGEGYEGVIVRSIDGRYKFNRSTAREGLLLKLKRYSDAEAVIYGYEELMHNDNPGYMDEQGHTRHTSHKANQRGGGVLGALQVEMDTDNRLVRFAIGTGFDMAQREALWTVRDGLIGKIVKFKFMPYGVLESTGVPRHPVYLGLRDPIDM